MSTSLIFYTKKESLPDDLKRALAINYNHFPLTLGSDDIDFLTGLKCAGIKTAQKLIDGINKNGEVVLDIES